MLFLREFCSGRNQWWFRPEPEPELFWNPAGIPVHPYSGYKVASRIKARMQLRWLSKFTWWKNFQKWFQNDDTIALTRRYHMKHSEFNFWKFFEMQQISEDIKNISQQAECRITNELVYNISFKFKVALVFRHSGFFEKPGIWNILVVIHETSRLAKEKNLAEMLHLTMCNETVKAVKMNFSHFFWQVPEEISCSNLQWTNFKMGRIDAWDELSLFGIWDELSLGTNCRLGRIVAWDELSLGTNCRLGRIVAQPEFTYLPHIYFWPTSDIDFSIADVTSDPTDDLQLVHSGVDVIEVVDDQLGLARVEVEVGVTVDSWLQGFAVLGPDHIRGRLSPDLGSQTHLVASENLCCRQGLHNLGFDRGFWKQHFSINHLDCMIFLCILCLHPFFLKK